MCYRFFLCPRSEYGQAFEPHYPKDGGSAVHEETSEKNSFFVTAIKDVLNTQANSDSESILDFLRNVQKSELFTCLTLIMFSYLQLLSFLGVCPFCLCLSVCLFICLSGVRRLKPQSLAAETPWQLPEVVSNLGEDLALSDKIEPLPATHGDGLIRERLQKQLDWERALSE